MSHFYGVIESRANVRTRTGAKTRTGTKAGGLTTTAASGDGAVRVVLEHDEELKLDRFRVFQVRWSGHGVEEQLAEGIVGRASR